MTMNLKKMLFASACVLFAGLTIVTVSSCEEGSANIEDYVGVQESDPYDPSKPIVISSFTPESGSVGQQVVIYGSNFGNDPDMIDLTIGGKKAVVVSVKGNCLYTFIPSKSFTGEIVMTIQGKTVTCADKFTYERKMVVGTLCGYKNALDNQGWQEGPFDGPDGVRAAGFAQDGTMQFSPYNHDQLFVVYDWGPGVWLIDLKERYVYNPVPRSMFNNQRLRTVDFIVDPFMYDAFGQLLGRATPEWEATATYNELRWREHLIISVDAGAGSTNWKSDAVYIVDRDQSGDFSSRSRATKLACYQACNGAFVHPNGETRVRSSVSRWRNIGRALKKVQSGTRMCRTMPQRHSISSSPSRIVHGSSRSTSILQETMLTSWLSTMTTCSAPTTTGETRDSSHHIRWLVS